MLQRLHNLWKRILGFHVCFYVTQVKRVNGITQMFTECKTCGKRLDR